MGIYATWDIDDWNFGTNGQYPVLKIDVNGDGTAGDATDLRTQRLLHFRQTSYAFAILNTASINDVVGIVRAVPEDANNGLTYSMGISTEFSITVEAETNNLSKVGQISVKGALSPNIYTLNVEVTEAGGGTATVEVRIKVGRLLDADTDGLIEVSTLEQLNAIRYDLDGNGEGITNEAAYSAAFGIGICTHCIGYELINDLDFNDSNNDGTANDRSKWAEGSTASDRVIAGWEPIGGNRSGFTPIFEGNGHTISNLFIDRSSTSYVGLFGYVIGRTVRLRNIGLLEVKVKGNDNVGGLVGSNEVDISNSYATGSVTGDNNVGGLVGYNEGDISNSYATGSVTGTGDIGGLVGNSQGSTISDSYATGSVTGTGDNVGGLVGYNDKIVSNSYATGSVRGTGTVHVGGLVGFNDGGTVTASYYNSETTGQSDVDKGESKTTAELLAPTGYTGIYDSWDDDSTDDWDFGTNEEYPVLNIDVNGNGIAGDANDLALQRPARLSVNLTNLDFVAGGEGKDFIITSNVAWTAEVSAGGDSWLMLDITSGANNATVSATAAQNVVDSPRMATITLTAGTLVWIITVTQVAALTVPVAPTNLTATAVSEMQIDLTWDAPSDGGSTITGYDLEYSVNGSDPWKALTTSGTMTTFSDNTDLTRGTTRHYRVAAINNVGTGASSEEVSATTHDVPNAPKNLTATPGEKQVTLSWVVPANGGKAITHYAIKIAGTRVALESSGAVQVAVTEVTGGDGSAGTNVNYVVTMTGVDSGTPLVNNTEYFFQVAAVNSVDTGEYSASGSATPGTSAPPAVPASLTATPGDAQVTLSWVVPANGGETITHYAIKIEDTRDALERFIAVQVAVAEVTGDVTSVGANVSYIVTVTGVNSGTALVNGTTYFFQIAAVNSIGTGNYTATIDATTTVPDAPTNLTATVVSDTQISLSWDAPLQDGGLAITGYDLEFSVDGNEPWTDLTTSVTTTSFSDNTGLTAGSTRHYRVAAINSVGTGAYSEETSATTHDVPVAPTNLRATAVSDTEIDLTWEVLSDGGSTITGYDLEYSEDGSEPWIDLTTSSTMTTFSDDTGLTRGTTRHYRVAAINSVGTGASSEEASATTYNVPNPPTSLTATPGETQVTLSWVVPANGGDDITYYAIKIAGTRVALESSGAVQVAVAEVTGGDGSAGTNVNYVVTMTGVGSGTPLVNDTEYFFQVAAVNSVDTGEYSASDSATPGTSASPAVPASLTVTPGDAKMTLSWEVPANGGEAITHYAIKIADTRVALERFIAVQVAVADLTGDGTSVGANVSYIVTVTGVNSGTALVNGTTYFFQIAAVNSIGTGNYTATIDATTTMPDAPNLTAAVVSDTQIDLTWDAPSDGGSAITGYDLEYSVDGSIPWMDLTTSATTIAFSDNTDLTAGTTRHYRVAAINNVGTGAYSDEVSATTHDVPDAPTSLTATPGETQVTLSWVVPANGGDDITYYAIKIAGTRVALESSGAVQVAVAEVTGGDGSAGTNVNYVVTMTGVGSGTPLVNDTEYFFQVAAVNSVDTGEYSASDSATPGTSASPAVPASLTVTPGDAKMTLSWEVPANGGEAITHYAIKIADTREALGSFVGVQVAVGDLTGDVTSVGANVSYIVTVTGVNSGTALVNGTTYFFQIAAVNSIGTGNYTATIDATTTMPDAPNLTAAVVSDTQIDLTWDAPSDGGSAITGYDLEYSVDGSIPWMDLTTSATTIAFSDNTDLTAGTTRHYRVAAINNVGTGAYSDEVSATTHDVPDAPTNLMAAVVSETQIDLSWDAPSEDGGSTITGYDLEYSVDGSIPWMDLTTSATTIAFSDNTGLTAGSTRHYRVAAINNVGTGEYSTTTDATTATATPGTPTNLTATAVSDTQIDLSWDAPSQDGGSAITDYDLEYSEDGNEPWTDLTTSVTTTSFDDTGLTAGSTRHYRVAAINNVGTGAYSEEVSATAGSPVLLSVPLEVEDSPGVYPNPGSDKVYVNLPNGNGAYVVRLHTLTGKVVLQKQLQGGGTRTLSLSKLQDGLYILNVQKDGQNSSYRLIKATH